jgi:hypothetical protein
MATPCHLTQFIVFTALNVADLALTWFLLERSGGHCYEANPVASWLLVSFGWAGLAGFKLASIVVVAALVLMVSRTRPRTAGGILNFGCSVLVGVVFYSGYMVREEEAMSATLGQLEKQQDSLEKVRTRQLAHWALLDRLRDDLAARRCTLAAAVESLAASELAQDPQWLRWLEDSHPGLTPNERLAIRLIGHANPPGKAQLPGARQLARELDAQFWSCFGHPFTWRPKQLADG